MHHFGFTSSSASIVLHTDSEWAVAELVGKSHEQFVFTVRRARPQQPQSVGLAERGVRRLKEGLPMLLVYLALTHNQTFFQSSQF